MKKLDWSLHSIHVKLFLAGLVFSFSIGLGLVFPSDTYATSFSFPTSGYWTTFKSDTYAGCLFDNYELDNTTVFLGSNSVPNITTASNSPLYNCGYYYSNNSTLAYNGFNPAIKRTIGYNANSVIYTDTYTIVSNSLASNSANSGFQSYSFDLYNAMYNFYIKYNDSTTTPNPISLTGVSASAGSWATFLVAYDMPFTSAFNGVQVRINPDYVNDTPAGSDLTKQDVINSYINPSLVSWCGSMDTYTPDDVFSYEHTAPNGYVTCYITGSVPLFAGVSWTPFINSTIEFLPADSSTYSNFTTTGGVNLTQYGYPWSYMHRSPSYKIMNAKYDGSLRFINPYFELVTCTDEDSCLAFYSNFENLVNARSNNTDGSKLVENDIPSDYSSWFDVFVLGLTFPFEAFFNQFVGHDTCAYIPMLASWLHTDNTTYCTWWSPTVINTLTPVFTVVPMMILFGFIMSWLKGDTSSSVFSFDDGKGGK